MPPFVLPDEKGRLTSLENLLQNGPIAITFHRGHWCPWCRISASVMAQAGRDIAAARGQIAAIMPERQRFAVEFKSNTRVAISRLYRHGQRLRTVAELGHLGRAGFERLLSSFGRLLPDYQGNDAWMLPISGNLRGRTRWYRDGTLYRSGFSPTNVDRGIDRGARSRVEARHIAPGYRVDSQSILSRSSDPCSLPAHAASAPGCCRFRPPSWSGGTGGSRRGSWTSTTASPSRSRTCQRGVRLRRSTRVARPVRRAQHLQDGRCHRRALAACDAVEIDAATQFNAVDGRMLQGLGTRRGARMNATPRPASSKVMRSRSDVSSWPLSTSR